jgi:hypothetical protein
MHQRTIFLAGILALLTLLPAFAIGQTAAPEATAKAFYKWYVHELNAEKNPIDQKAKLRQYVSQRLYRWVGSKAYEEYGADYFIDAQDYAHDWEKNIDISAVSIKGTTASLRVTLRQPANGEMQAWNRILDLKLLKEGGAWKIDRIKGKN